jgi:mannose/cellobiose epimerase-like protein (N-acyl-D-glucosamine 2-epimerase family)
MAFFFFRLPFGSIFGSRSKAKLLEYSEKLKASYLDRVRARRFQSGFVMTLNQKKKPAKQKKNVWTAVSAVKALFMMAMIVNMRNASPPKHAVMRDVSLIVMGT